MFALIEGGSGVGTANILLIVEYSLVIELTILSTNLFETSLY